MVSNEQIKKAEETARNAFEATKRIYDLAFIAWRKMSADIGEQLGLKASYTWGRVDAGFINQYGRLTEAEVSILKRYVYTTFAGTKAGELRHNMVPFILFSIANRKLEPPQLIYGVLTKVDWGQGQSMEIDPFMYEISEKREQKPLEVRAVKTVSKKGSANVEFESLSLFGITNDTIGDITKEIVDWFNAHLT